jgi:hypothetical protein
LLYLLKVKAIKRTIQDLDKKMKYIKKLFLLSFILIPLHTAQNYTHDMIIFVHGTLRPAQFTFSSLIKIMNNKIDKSIYSATAKELRGDSFFYQGQPIQGLGLKTVNQQDFGRSNGAACIAALYDKQYEFLKNNTPKLYYTFGWNGLLNARKRYEEAKNLYKALVKEIIQLRQQNIEPRIKFITYSHGANVVLNIGAILHDDPTLKNNIFTIDTLAMFGAPIQRVTDYLVSHPIFKKVYHFYSSEDSIQTLDIFAPRQFFSGKRFSNRSRFKVPEKVKQIRLRVTKRIARLHKAKNVDRNSYKVLSHKKLRLVHQDPGHTELWNFRWGAHWYRDCFPLNPIPISALTPSIIDTVEKHFPERRNITFDYALSHAGALLVPAMKRNRKAVPVLNKKTTKELFSLASHFKPENYTLDGQNEKIRQVLDKVKQHIKKNKKPRSSRLLFSYFNKKRVQRSPQSQKLRHTHLLSAKL